MRVYIPIERDTTPDDIPGIPIAANEEQPDHSTPDASSSTNTTQNHQAETRGSREEEGPLRDPENQPSPPPRPNAPQWPQTDAEAPLVDISDLSLTVSIPAQTSEQPYSPPPATFQSFFTSRTWYWDAAWKEFYTQNPADQTFIYISRWRINQVTWRWEHFNFDAENYTPDNTLRLLTDRWDDWRWDANWGEWFMNLPSHPTASTCCLYVSPWKPQEDGTWVYVERGGLGATQGQATQG